MVKVAVDPRTREGVRALMESAVVGVVTVVAGAVALPRTVICLLPDICPSGFFTQKVIIPAAEGVAENVMPVDRTVAEVIVPEEPVAEFIYCTVAPVLKLLPDMMKVSAVPTVALV